MRILGDILSVMQTFLTPLTIFITTCASFAVGMLWYSPFLFLNAWLKGEGLTLEKLPKREPVYLAQTHFYSFIAHGAIVSVLAVMFDLLSVSTLKAALSLGLLLAFGFIIAPKFIDMIYTTKGKHYESVSQLKFLVASGYYLVVVSVMSVVLFLVSAR